MPRTIPGTQKEGITCTFPQLTIVSNELGITLRALITADSSGGWLWGGDQQAGGLWGWNQCLGNWNDRTLVIKQIKQQARLGRGRSWVDTVWAKVSVNPTGSPKARITLLSLCHCGQGHSCPGKAGRPWVSLLFSQLKQPQRDWQLRSSRWQHSWQLRQ